MAQYGMGDEATIDEIIEDVDTDKVSFFSLLVICGVLYHFLLWIHDWFSDSFIKM